MKIDELLAAREFAKDTLNDSRNELLGDLLLDLAEAESERVQMKIDEEIEFPTLHSNGSGAAALTEGLCDASEALRGAIAALEQSAPNARDYYIISDTAFSRARDQHVARVRALMKIRTEIESIVAHVADQTDSRFHR